MRHISTCNRAQNALRCIHRPKGTMTARCAPRHVCRASAKVDEYLSTANEKMSRKDRIGAQREWEKALKEDLSDELRMTLLYNMTATYAYFGDVELAQVPMREALALGLDFDAALSSPGPGMVPWQSSQQVIISLRKFRKAVVTAQSKAPKAGTSGPARGVEMTPSGIKSAMASEDISDVLGAEMKGIDTSLAGIAKRVLLLLVSLVGLGAVLWWLGLEFLFPSA